MIDCATASKSTNPPLPAVIPPRATESLRCLLRPRSVAIIGASRDPAKVGGAVLANLINAGFTGEVYPVNAKDGMVAGRRAFRSLAEIPGPVDMAIIAVPSASIDSVVDDCARKGVQGLVVLTAGFGECGPEGRQREAALRQAIRSAGMRMVGPNCIGLMNTDALVRLNASFITQFPAPGNVALLSQSGAMGVTILDYVRGISLGLSMFVSVGNKADVSGNDLLEYWADDKSTHVILLYLESFGNPRKFRSLAQEVGRSKPIIAVKSGTSKSGSRAAASHTGALAQSDRIINAMFRQTGVIRTGTLEEMLDVASLLANQPVPQGRRVAILTNAGGPGIMAADACEAHGLEVPALQPVTVEALRAFLPREASVNNPVDMIASATPHQFGQAAQALLADEGVDSLLVLFIPVLATQPGAVAQEIIRAARHAGSKPVLATFMSEHGMPELLFPVPSFRFPEAAVGALAKAAAYGQWRGRPRGQMTSFDDMSRDRIRAIIDDAVASGGGWLDIDRSRELLEACGIRLAQVRAADTFESALQAARAIGYPIVLKAVGPTILHKTEVGGVRLGISDDADLETAYRDMAARLGSALSGVAVQEMVVGGAEFIAGAATDPVFGPFVLFGSGGTLVELLADASMRLVPLTDVDVDDMLHEVRGTALMRGYRGAPQADEAAMRELLMRLSAMIEIAPEILEIDLNPVKVLARGVVAVDARVRIAQPSGG